MIVPAIGTYLKVSIPGEKFWTRVESFSPNSRLGSVTIDNELINLNRPIGSAGTIFHHRRYGWILLLTDYEIDFVSYIIYGSTYSHLNRRQKGRMDAYRLSKYISS